MVRKDFKTLLEDFINILAETSKDKVKNLLLMFLSDAINFFLRIVILHKFENYNIKWWPSP